MSLEVVQTLGKYEIRGTLGRGAMGIVYEGWDPLIARRVAVKAVRLPEHPETETEEEIARFRREAQAAGRLTHPNIVGVYDYGETSDLAYIVMEFVDGTTLKRLLDRQERFAVADISRIMQDVLSGLQYSHSRGVVHRDIKPANIILTSAGQAKIADFGIARIESSSMTQAGTVLGTPAYMSPEQFTGQVVTARTDIYSAGVLLYQLLTGERPFEGSVTSIMHKVLNTDPPLPSELAVTSPAALDAVVRRAMSKRPEDRYPSAAAFAEAIATAVAVQPATTPSAPEAEATVVSPSVRQQPAASRAASPAPGSKRSGVPLLIAAGVAAIVVFATGGWWFVLRPAPPAEPAAVQHPAAPSLSPAAQATSPPPTSPKPTEQAATVPSNDQRAAVAPPPPPQTKATPNAPPATAPASPIAPAPPPAAAPQASASATPPLARPTSTTAHTPPGAASVPPLAPSPAPPEAPQATASAAAPPPADHPTASPPKAEPVATTQLPLPSSPQAATSPPVSVPPGGTPTSPPTGSSTTGTPEQVATIELGSLHREIERVLASTSCTLANSIVQDSGTVTVTGIAGRSADDALRRDVAELAGPRALDWRMQRVDSVFCGALTAIQPISTLAGAQDKGLRLSLVGDRTVLHDDEYIPPRVVMPNYAGWLRVDYLTHDGTLVHLYPSVADPQLQKVALAAHVLHPGETLAIRPQWQVGPPFGTDMIIAVASSVPLFDRPPQQNIAADVTDYFRSLGRAIEAAQNRGARVSGTVMLVDTVPKPKTR